jgi:hypothetical protein
MTITLDDEKKATGLKQVAPRQSKPHQLRRMMHCASVRLPRVWDMSEIKTVTLKPTTATHPAIHS